MSKLGVSHEGILGVCLLLLTLGAPIADAADITTKGYVNIYPVMGPPVRAKANEALVSLHFDEDALAADTDTIVTGGQGQFEWQAAPAKPTPISLDAGVSEQPGQYRLKKPRSFMLENKDVDLKEVRLFDVRRAAQELFAEEQTTLTAMRAEYPCLRLGKTLEQIWACWLANPARSVQARAKVREALSRLQAITNHPQQIAVVRERLSLMTSAAMFCAESAFGSDQDWIDLSDSMVQEQAESLMFCAQGLSVDPMPLSFSEVRTFLRAHVERANITVKRRLLFLWLNSYFREAQETELVKFAAWINDAGLFEEWRALMGYVSQTVPEFPSFFENTATAEQIAAVKKALA